MFRVYMGSVYGPIRSGKAHTQSSASKPYLIKDSMRFIIQTSLSSNLSHFNYRDTILTSFQIGDVTTVGCRRAICSINCFPRLRTTPQLIG